MSRGAIPILIGLLATSIALPARAQSTASRPTTNPRRLEALALAKAIDALAKEYEAVLKDPEQPIRVECDYFRQNPAPLVTHSGVLDVLERSGGDARLACYVKWQLLSAVDGKLDESLAVRAVAVYRKLPPLIARPGITPREQKELDLLAQGRSQDQEAMVEYKFLEGVGKFNAYNAPLLRFRDDLYAKLPASYDALGAGWDDARQRLNAGVAEADFRPLVARLVDDTRAWAGSERASSRELRSISRLVSRLLTARGPSYYSTVKWRSREGRLVWTVHTPSLNEKGALGALASELAERVRGI